MRIADSACGSSPSVFMRLKVSRHEMPASTRIRVRALATTAQLPRLPEASIVTLTPIAAHPYSQHTRPPCGTGSNSSVIRYLRAETRPKPSDFRPFSQPHVLFTTEAQRHRENLLFCFS